MYVVNIFTALKISSPLVKLFIGVVPFSLIHSNFASKVTFEWLMLLLDNRTFPGLILHPEGCKVAWSKLIKTYVLSLNA
jgi:hypothetical protein